MLCVSGAPYTVKINMSRLAFEKEIIVMHDLEETNSVIKDEHFRAFRTFAFSHSSVV